MKTKLYSLTLFAFFAFALSASAQCSVTMTSLTTNGLTATGTSTGSGAAVPVYVWAWGDAATSTTQNANHTYANAGTYTVCVGYTDATNSNCLDTACQTITVSATSGIATNTPVKAEVQTMPNPFSVATTISLTLNQQSDVSIVVYDITGKEVATLQNGQLDSGFHMITWKPESLADGVYFMQIKAGGSVQTKKIIHTTGN